MRRRSRTSSPSSRRTTRPTTRSSPWSGDCERAQVRAWADRYFGPIPAYPVIPPAPAVALPPVIGSEVRETVEDRVPLTRVYLAFRAPAFGDPRFDALDVATSLLSGSKSSRLHRRLVREERLAQDVVISMVPGVGGASICVGWATVRPGVDAAAVETAYLEELARLAAEPPSEDEMIRTMALAEADELGALARVDERAERLATFATYFDDPGMVNEVLSRYLAVTPERVREAAAEVFRADNRVILTYVPRPGAAGEDGPADDGDDAGDEGELDA